MTVHHTYIPQPPLPAFVQMFWLYEGQQQHARERRLPDGSMELVINLREETLRVYDRQQHDQFQSFRGGLISGAHSEYVVLDTTCAISCSQPAHQRAGFASSNALSWRVLLNL